MELNVIIEKDIYVSMHIRRSSIFFLFLFSFPVSLLFYGLQKLFFSEIPAVLCAGNLLAVLSNSLMKNQEDMHGKRQDDHYYN